MAVVAGGRRAFSPCKVFKFQQFLNTQWTKSVNANCVQWMAFRNLIHSPVFSNNSQCLVCGHHKWPCSTLQLNCSNGRSISRRQLNHQRSLWSSSVLYQAPHVFEPGSFPNNQETVDPVKLVADDLQQLFINIHKELQAENTELKQMSQYYFDGKGKAVRPLMVALMGRAINFQLQGVDSYLTQKQRKLAMVLEMMHTATLFHDDVVDGADRRRGKPSVNAIWDEKKAVLTGDYLVSVLTEMLVQIGNHQVIQCICEVMQDLVVGELMQLGSKETENERFKYYLTKTFKKTASLLAFGCKSVAILGSANESVQETAFQFGRNVGIAFQLVDDLLDFVSSSELLGKPAATDLKLGLATAPVLFACEKFPELNNMITRRFSQPGDVEAALNAVMKSDGLAQTKFLAEQHSREAIRHLEQLTPSPELKALFIISDKMLNRIK